MPAAVRHPRTLRHPLARLQVWSVVPRVAVPIRRAATEFVALLVRDAAAEPVVRRSNAAGTAWFAAQVAHRSVEPIAAVPNNRAATANVVTVPVSARNSAVRPETLCATGRVATRAKLAAETVPAAPAFASMAVRPVARQIPGKCAATGVVPPD